MAEFYLVFRGAILGRCEAPDKHTATDRLRPKDGARIVSKASWDLDGARDNVVQKCMYGCGRDSASDAKSCQSCATQHTQHRVRPQQRPKQTWHQRHPELRNENQRNYRAGRTDEQWEADVLRQRLESRARYAKAHPNVKPRTTARLAAGEFRKGRSGGTPLGGEGGG